MGRRYSIKEYVAGALLALSAVFFILSLDISGGDADSTSAARKMERALNSRMTRLETFMLHAASSESWLDIKGLSEDMVIYRYVADTLQSWQHLFPIKNDDISFRILYQRLTNPKTELVSPLMDVGEEPVFKSLGTGNYILTSISEGEVKVIGGLLIRKPQSCSLLPLLESEGEPVSIGGVPVFRLAGERRVPSPVQRVPLLWVAVLLVVASILVFLSDRRDGRSLAWTLGIVSIVLIAFYLWGRTIQDSLTIFSPILFAGGTLFYSLGAILIINLELLTCSAALFITRDYCRNNRGTVVASLALAAAIPVYTFIAFRSIIFNSGIELEIFKLEQVNIYTAIVYSSFLPLLSFIPLLLHIVQPQMRRKLHLRLRPVSARGRMVFALLAGIFLTAVTGIFGVRKDMTRMESWASRLVMDRDISLELQMRSVEKAIGEDAFIGSLSALGNTAIISGRLSDMYFPRLSQSYDISVSVLDPSNVVPELLSAFNDHLTRGIPIADGSHFRYLETPRGTVRYCGIFTYVDPTYGAFHMMIDVDPKIESNKHGFASILGLAPGGKVNLPRIFSYARYHEGKLSFSSGTHSYPTVEPNWSSSRFYAEGKVHHVVRVSDDEDVVISRPKVGVAIYSLSVALLALLTFIISGAPVMGRRRQGALGKNYYRSRVTSVLVISLVTTLVVMAAASVLFVYNRNESNLHEIMSDKITSLQRHIESRCSYANDYRDLAVPEFSSALEQLGDISKLDITLYTPSGQAFFTTAPEVYDRKFIGGRMDGNAFHNIVHRSRRYFIQRERIAGIGFYAMYAPVTNSEGSLIAIIGAPYTPERYDFGREVILHSSAILLVFIILLIMSRFMTAAIVDKMFRPLMALGRRMGAGDVESLEHLEYDRDDEISVLVDSYNRMVDELSESTRQLAQAERDKAWSAMARQVAHEIKNPLTPMKLQIQRIMRLKARGDESWQEKFDEMARVMLYHIDVLSDTANEFSTFAKLYSEEHTDIDLDALLQEEIAMFDSKGSVRFIYMGLPGCVVSGPRPQLTRVFVNILGNAVQAVTDPGSPAQEDPQVMVSLRKGVREGFYDIVFEDNGPGVSDENRDKLFTPNFTTKSGGTGLGLAISRSILERCGATISYSKSFAMGGACFTITYPGKEVQKS